MGHTVKAGLSQNLELKLKPWQLSGCFVNTCMRQELKDVGSHEQVGCEKPATLSGRYRSEFVVAVGNSVCVGARVCTMWESGHSAG